MCSCHLPFSALSTAATMASKALAFLALSALLISGASAAASEKQQGEGAAPDGKDGKCHSLAVAGKLPSALMS